LDLQIDGIEGMGYFILPPVKEPSLKVNCECLDTCMCGS